MPLARYWSVTPASMGREKRCVHRRGGSGSVFLSTAASSPAAAALPVKPQRNNSENLRAFAYGHMLKIFTFLRSTGRSLARQGFVALIHNYEIFTRNYVFTHGLNVRISATSPCAVVAIVRLQRRMPPYIQPPAAPLVDNSFTPSSRATFRALAAEQAKAAG